MASVERLRDSQEPRFVCVQVFDGQRSRYHSTQEANDGGLFDFKIIHPADEVVSEIVDRETFGQLGRLTTARKV